MKNIIRYPLSFLSAVFKPLRALSTPIHIQLEPTTYCNLTCPQCPRDVYIKTQEHMSLSDFQDIIDRIAPTHLTLSGIGEPTLNPVLGEMIGHARRRRINVNTTSNFVATSAEQMAALIENDLNLLNVSVDAADPETYRAVRCRDAFSAVTQRVERFLALRRRMGRSTPTLRLTYVVQRQNLQSMVDFLELGKQLGVDAIFYQVFTDSDIKAKQNLIDGIELGALGDQIDQLKQKTAGGGYPSTNVDYLTEKIDILTQLYQGKSINFVEKCIKPWVSLYVTVNGTVRPCCSFGAKECDMGNILGSAGLSTVFNNERYRAFRKKLRRGVVPDPICAKCIPESPMDVVKRSRWTPNFLLRRRLP